MINYKYLHVPPDDILCNTGGTPATVVQQVLLTFARQDCYCLNAYNCLPPLLLLTSSFCEQTRAMNPSKGYTVKMDPDCLQNVINMTVDTRGRKKRKTK